MVNVTGSHKLINSSHVERIWEYMSNISTRFREQVLGFRGLIFCGIEMISFLDLGRQGYIAYIWICFCLAARRMLLMGSSESSMIIGANKVMQKFCGMLKEICTHVIVSSRITRNIKNLLGLNMLLMWRNFETYTILFLDNGQYIHIVHVKKITVKMAQTLSARLSSQLSRMRCSVPALPVLKFEPKESLSYVLLLAWQLSYCSGISFKACSS